MRSAEVVEQLRQLPSRPSAVSQALTVLDDPNASASDIARSLHTDPSLCARVLHLANSPFLGLSGKVGSLERAVVAVGASPIRSLAVTTAAGIFNDDPDAMPPDFSQHSIAVAAGTTVAATVFGIPSGDAMCAGLLHDLGSALAYRFARDRYEQLVDDADRVTLAEREQEAFGADHAALGAFALEAWKLPRLIVDAIRCHHDDPSGVANRLAGAIIAGEALARHANPDAGFSHEIALPPDVAFSSLGNPNAAIDTLVERTIETTAELESLLVAR